MLENSIIEWNGDSWVVVFDPSAGEVPTYFTNLKSGIQYKWTGEFWVKSFEGEYADCNWGFLPDESGIPLPEDNLPQTVSTLDLAKSLSLSYVQGNAAAEAQIQAAFDEISSVILSGPSITYTPDP
jgi:hypothetical protein